MVTRHPVLAKRRKKTKAMAARSKKQKARKNRKKTKRQACQARKARNKKDFRGPRRLYNVKRRGIRRFYCTIGCFFSIWNDCDADVVFCLFDVPVVV